MAHLVGEWTKMVAKMANIVAEMPHFVPEMPHIAGKMMNRVDVVFTRHGELAFYPLMPLSH